MKFNADLHIHSLYSRATSKLCDPPNLWVWAQKKGITLLGTGDFTHPEWKKLLQSRLEPAEPGLFALKNKFARQVKDQVPASCKGDVRFILSAEISSIYKRGGRTRKVHNLLYAPDFAAAGKINRALGRIGNLKSDGRPILGLDSYELLKIVLNEGDSNHLIPAHIWTPWFSLFGSKSGFDSIEECFGDLSDRIFALETGLSSDPEMNWRLSALDRFSLIANSDCHSPQKIGRNANMFDCDLSYTAVFDALKTRKGFGGTFDMFPDLGKYHMDGHRKCGILFDPDQTKKSKGLCPVCAKPVTVGVMNRVCELADRKTGEQPKGAPGFFRLVPLDEIISEVIGKGSATKSVSLIYEKMLSDIGPELSILRDAEIENIKATAGADISRAIRLVRDKKVKVIAGYDGEYGKVKIFGDSK